MRRSRLVPLVLVLLVIFAGPSLITFYTDWLWFGEVGYQFVYSTMAVVGALAIGKALTELTPIPNLSIVFLMAVLFSAMNFGIWPAILGVEWLVQRNGRRARERSLRSKESRAEQISGTDA